MTKIDIFSGFLGAGKTTLIKKLIAEAFTGEKLVLIENEFGEIAIDGGFLQDSGVVVNEMNSGCICCSLVGDFKEALLQVIEQYHPDRILIEPSGVGKLSDVIAAVKNLNLSDVELNSFTTIADANKCKMYMKNFGEFYNDQIEHANCIVLSRTDGIDLQKLIACMDLLRGHNQQATVIATPWDQLTGAQILEAMEHKNTTVADDIKALEHEHHHHHDHEHCDCGHDHHDHEHHHDHCDCGHDHHDHEHHEHCDCGHDHHDHEHHHEHCDCGHDHHDHEHHEHCDCGHDHHDHEHHHDHCDCGHDHHDHEHHEHCDCGHDHHDHDHHEHCGCGHDHHHHHADEIFTSWGVETARKYTKDEITAILSALDDADTYGAVLRAKGIVMGEGCWLHFDFVPGESEVREGSAAVIGRLCVIGTDLNEENLQKLFA